MKRIVLALLAIALLAPVALSRTGDSPRPAHAQTTATAPEFADDAITLLLDEGADGSSTAIALGTPAFAAGTISGGTDACSESNEFLNADLSTFVSSGGTASAVFTVGADCAITYTGGATDSAISATRAGWSLTIALSDGVDASGNTDATVDDTIQVTIKIVNATSDTLAARALYDGTGGDGWAARANWTGAIIITHTYELTSAQYTTSTHDIVRGYDSRPNPDNGAIRNNSGTIVRGGTTYSLLYLYEDRSNNTGINVTVRATSGSRNTAHWSGTRWRYGTQERTANLVTAVGWNSTDIYFQMAYPLNATIPISGDFVIHLLGAATTSLAANWHGVTVDADGRLLTLDLSRNGLAGAIPVALGDFSRLTSLDLSGDGLTGAIPPELGQLSALTSLNLRGNRGLTGHVGALTRISGLTFLDLRDTGLCVDATNQPGVQAWVDAIRARGGTAHVPACAAPAFEDETITYLLDAGANGSSTAIAVGTPVVTAGGVAGGTDACAKTVEVQQADVSVSGITGTTSTVFTVGADCAITYTGAATASTITSARNGWALRITVSDGVNASGAADTSADDSIDVKVKLVSAATDIAAVKALYDGTTGASWTTSTNWTFTPAADVTINSMAGTAQNSGSWRGFSSGSGGFGTMTSGVTFTHSGTTYTIRRLYWFQNAVRFGITPQSGGPNFVGLRLTIGSRTGTITSTPNTNFGTPGAGYQILVSMAQPFTANTAYTATLVQPAARIATGWHGATVASGRLTVLTLNAANAGNNLAGPIAGALGDLNKLTTLNLGDNAGLTGAIPAELGRLTALTSLDLGVDDDTGSLTGAIPASLGRLTALTTLNLSGHANLTGRIPGALTRIRGLTTLDLSGTGVCVDPAAEPGIESWLNAIRARSGGVALVDTCGSPAAPAFAASAVTLGVQSGVAGSTVPVAVGAAPYTASGYSGARHACTIESAIDNTSTDPASFLTTGTARTGFVATASGGACVIAYTGAAIPGTVAAVSVRVGVSDGVDATGASDDATDGTIDVTVKVRGLGTDGDALHHLYNNGGGATWTTRTGWWDYPLLHTFALTGGSGGGFTGFYSPSSVGAIRLMSGSVTLGGNTYTLVGLYEVSGSTRISASGTTRSTSDWDGLRLRIGTVTHAESAATDGTATIVIEFPFPTGTVPSSGDFTAQLLGTTLGNATLTADSTWHGVTISGGRVTALDLSNNNLTGAAGMALAQLGELDGLTALDLSSPAQADLPMGTTRTPNAFTGAIPAGLGALTALTALDLSGAGFSGALPAELGDLTALTSLDLSDNAGLTATPAVLDALAAGLTSLTNLDLTGTGICLDAARPGVSEWLGAIRARSGGVAQVVTCGSPAAPAFSAATATYVMESGVDGSTTAIAVGAPAFTGGTFAGGEPACAITTAFDNTSNDPTDFLTTGTARTGFTATASGNTCAIEYGGAALPASLAAVSIVLTVSDGIDPAAGTLDADADGTINVTVKVRGIGTDGDALHHLFNNAGGASWTTTTGWRGAGLLHTFAITAGSGSQGRGYRHPDIFGAVGSFRSGQTVTLGSNTYTIQGIYQRGSNANVQVAVTGSPSHSASDWNDLRLRIGTVTGAETSIQTLLTALTIHFAFPANTLGGSGNYDILLLGMQDNVLLPLTATSTWHGVTIASSRVTGLNLSNNNLTGAAATALAQLPELGLLASLDLSSPAQADLPMGTTRTPNALTGAIPPTLGDVTTLTTLDLSGNSLSDSIPAELGDLTALTSLDLSDNSLSGALPSELEDLTALTSLDLSGNAGLTATTTVLDALATNLTSLTMLDLSGTGICVDPSDTMQADVVTWIGNIRGTSGGVAKVNTCGSPAAPTFRDEAVTYGLESMSDGSSTAIAIGSAAFTAGTYVGGDTTTCAIASAIDNTSNDPAMFLTTGTARTGFAVALNAAGNACAITYTGTGVPVTLAAVSLAITVTDGIDPDEGTIEATATADDTINVTVKVRGLGTDEDALHHLYNNAGGASWTARPGWRAPEHTFEITAGSSGSYRGYRVAPLGSPIGSVRNNSNTFTVNSVAYTAIGVYLDTNNQNNVIIALTPTTNNFSGFTLGVGTNEYTQGSPATAGGRLYLFFNNTAAGTIGGSGNVDVRLYGASPGLATLAATSTWHGVTITGGRVAGLALPGNNLRGDAATALAMLNELDGLTTLNLSGNTGLTGAIPAVVGRLTRLTSLNLSGAGFSGALPAELGDLTSLTSLNLSGNAGLTASATVLGTLATNLTSLTNLDLSGTGICVDPSDMDQMGIVTWIGNIRGSGLGTGVAKVNTCGSPAAPAFPQEAVTYELESGADGSTTAIAIGAPAFTAGSLFVGGEATCRLASARSHGSNAPGDFITSGGTDVSSDFTVTLTGSTCAITYTGSGLDARDQSLEAVSVAVGVNDGIAPDDGRISALADDTINVTVKLTNGEATDRDALIALYEGYGGSAWDPGVNWLETVRHTFQLTGGSGTASGALGSAVGYQDAGVGSGAIGGLRGGGSYMLGGVTYSIRRLLQFPNGNVLMRENQGGQANSRYAGLGLRVGTTTLSFAAATPTSLGTNKHWTWAGQASGLIPSSGNFDAWLVNINPVLSGSWTGVTVASNRVTGLALPDYGVTGTATGVVGALAPLGALTALDLSSTPGTQAMPNTSPNAITGAIPAALGDFTTLTSLDLSGNSLSGAIPAELGMLTSLTSLDLGGNSLSGNIPTELGDLTALTSLDLGGNSLSGNIPTEVGMLTALETLDLGGNSLSGAVPALANLTDLTSLDLSGNAGLTATGAQLEALSAPARQLTLLDLSGTGVCADPGDPTQSSVEGWIGAIRTQNTNTGVAKVRTCGSPAAPAFTAARLTLGLEDGDDGSSTAIPVGTPTFTQGGHVGGRTATCAITTARTNPSNAPGDFSTTSGSDVSGDFVIDGATCAITYTGTGITSQDNVLEAVSIGVTITDGIDPEAGTIDTTADSTVEVTVKLRGIATDRDAIDAFYTATGGSGWTTKTGGWGGEHVLHTFELTATQNANRVGYDTDSANTVGMVRNNSGTVTLGGTTYTLQVLARRTANNLVSFHVSPRTDATTAFAGLTVRVGSTELNINDATPNTIYVGQQSWRWTSQAGFLSVGDFDAVLVNKNPALDSTWHGVTVSGTPERVTGLELPDNNLVGTIPASFSELDRITALDLSGNPGLVGDGAAPVTAIAAMQGLTTLDLSGIGWTTLAAGLGPALGSLTTLDLSDNRFTALPTDLGMLTALTSLDLSGNALTGEAPEWIGDLTALTTLDLSGNRFTDVHADFNALTALETLDLSGNDLAGANFGDIATAISAMTALTSLDLSGNARLSGSIPAALLMVTGLESLDLSGTGVCVNPATETTVETWLNAIRARNTNTGVAKVATCGSPAAPAWSATSIRGSLEAMADGSTTAITIATPTFTEGTYSGGATETCEIVTAKENASYDPADFTTTGTDVTGFTAAASGTTCTIAYEGTGLTATSTLAAVSIAVKISDGVDPVGGVVSDAADGTVRVTVKLVGLGTDRIALLDLYQSAGGSGWTRASGWTPPGNAALTSSWAGVTVAGNRLTGLALGANLLAGTLPESFADLSALTSLDLSANVGLRGNIPAVLGSLVSLTSLDLSHSGWSGPIPVELGSLSALTILDLASNGLSGNIPSELGSLTGLTTLLLNSNPDLGGDLSHLTNLTSLTELNLWGTRLCVNPTEQPAVETWLNGLRGNGALVDVRTCGSPAAPRLADAAATYLLDVGANGSSTPVVVGTPSFTGGSYSGGADACTFTAIANPSTDPASFLATGTAVTGFAVDSSCAITWTGNSAPTRVVGTRVAVSIGLSVTDGVSERGRTSTAEDDSMRVTVKLVDLATDRLGLEALYADTNGTGWRLNTSWRSATLSSSWHGVTVASSRVTALSLRDNGLSGRLPALMGDMSRLTTLDLSGNGGLAGGIPVEFTQLRSLTRLDLSGTRVCARNIGGAVNAWLNAVRAKPGGSVRLGSCPAPAAPGASAGITLSEEGPEAPSGLRYALLLECGSTSVTLSLGAGERYAASVAGGAVCSLTVTDRQGASAVRGEFSGLSLSGDVTVTIVRGVEEEDEDEPPVEMAGPDPDLERTLVAGTAFARWRGADEMPVEDAVEELTLCVVAVYWWDARAQAWRSWFPGAEGLGVNTLRSLRENGIYVFAAEERTPDNCGLLPDDDDGEDEDGEDGG